MNKKPQFTDDDLEFALEQAAEFLDMEEWPDDRAGGTEGRKSRGSKTY
jgi:hypothetical protein